MTPKVWGLIPLLLLLLLLASCCKPSTAAYREQYLHLKKIPAACPVEEGPFLLLLVDAPHLDYSSTAPFLATMSKHPDTYCKRGEVGHAWILLKGEGSWFEGGHTGEFGIIRPRYADGIAKYHAEGDPNPVRYLWESLDDGCLQLGAGGHTPTFAAKVNLSVEQFNAILSFVDPRCYPYHSYSLTRRQCVSFVIQAAALAGVELEAETTLPIGQSLSFMGKCYQLWEDEYYSSFTFASPDRLEKSLIDAVESGRAEPALDWYLEQRGTRMAKEPLHRSLLLFPERLLRFLSLRTALQQSD